MEWKKEIRKRKNAHDYMGEIYTIETEEIVNENNEGLKQPAIRKVIINGEEMKTSDINQIEDKVLRKSIKKSIGYRNAPIIRSEVI